MCTGASRTGSRSLRGRTDTARLPTPRDDGRGRAVPLFTVDEPRVSFGKLGEVVEVEAGILRVTDYDLR